MSIDPQLVLAIAGIILTVILGVLGIWVALKYSNSVGITYARELTIALIDDITMYFPELSISYKDESINENLVLLKGYFANTGRKDISGDMVERAISLNVPEDYEWVECNVVERSAALKANVKILGGRQLTFDLGLWKAKEFFKFEALIKVPTKKIGSPDDSEESTVARLNKATIIEHRIADSRNIKTIDIDPSKLIRKSVRSRFKTKHVALAVNILYLLSIVYVGVISPYYFPKYNLKYFVGDGGSVQEAEMKVEKDDIVFEGSKGLILTVPIAQYHEVVSSVKVAIEKKNNVAEKWMSLITLTILIGGLFFWVYSGYNERKILSIIRTNRTPPTQR